MLRICVLVSGSGSNLQAVIDAIKADKIKNAGIISVISNNKDAYALKRAQIAGIRTDIISPKDSKNREEFEKKLCHEVEDLNPDLIVLAGFLVKIPNELTEKFRGKIINIHPSLIPSFCGKGFYGLKVHEAALARGVKITGATVHVVDEGIDSGKILMQKAVNVCEGDTPKILQERVMKEAEWVILPMVISMISEGIIKL